MEDVSTPPAEGPAEIPAGVPGDFPLPLLVVMRLAVAFRQVFTEEMAREEWAVAANAAPPMYAVLRAATYLDGPSQRDIASSIGLDPSDLVGVLDQMQANGWVVRERDPADRRRHLVRTTQAGRAVLDRYNEVARRVGERIMAGLDGSERARFTEYAVRMLQGAGDDVGRLRRAANLG